MSFCLAIATPGFAVATASAGVLISEFMAVNNRTLADEDGEFSDWIELHNPTADSVNLDGWFLTDTETNLVKWRFPAVTLASEGYLVVFASDKNRANPAGPLHANFKLSSAGEYLALVQPDGVTIASEYRPAFPPQLPDISYGMSLKPGSEISLISTGTSVRVLVPTNDIPVDWTLPGFVPDTNWISGRTGVGFEVASGSSVGKVLFVVNTNASAAGKAGDEAVINRLSTVLGNQVAVVHDAVSQTSHTNGHDLIMVSSTVASGNVNTKFRDVSLPVIQWEAALADDFRLSASGANVSGQSAINITPAGAAHPVSTGLAAGSHAVRPTLTTFHLASSSSLAPGATVIATGGTGAPAILAVDEGGLLNNNAPSPGKRIHMFWGDDGVNGLNDTGLALFDAAVTWALSGVAGPRFYSGLIQTDVRAEMYGRNSSVLLSLAFTPAEVGRNESLALRVRYDDGFVAWLNGTEVARRNAPTALSWNSGAITERLPTLALIPESIDLSEHLGLLTAGTNVLAIQALNAASTSPNLLLLPELSGATALTEVREYFTAPTPGAPNLPGTLGLVPPVQFSVTRGFFTTPFAVELTNAMAETEIRFTTNGSSPSATTGHVYTGPIPVTGTMVLRAAAYRPGFFTTNAVAMTYLFPDQIIRQPLNVPGWPRPVLSVGQDTRQHDYEMDPAIANAAAYSNDVLTALTAIPTMSLAVHQPDMWDANGNGGFYRLTDVEKPVSVELIHPDEPNKDVLAHGSVQGHSHDRLKRSLRLSFKQPYGDSKFVSTLFRDAPLALGGEADAVDNIILRGGNNRCWARSWNPDRTTYTEDEWYRATQIAMSGVGTIGSFVHLYINGLYWGLYNPVQRPDDDFASHYLGGAKDGWFSVSHSGAHAGNPARWNYLVGPLAAKDMSNPTNYAELCDHLDVAQFIDYLLVSWYIGVTDWPNNNWWAAVPNSPPGRARFFAWDGEWSWGVGSSSARAWVKQEFRVSGGNTSLALSKLWHAARFNSDFLMLAADRACKHVSRGGALSDAEGQARWLVLSNATWRVVVPESARWGDTMLPDSPRTRDVDWQNEIRRIDGLMTGNGAQLLTAMRAEGYYPSIDPPTFNQAGGVVPAHFPVELNHPNASANIYFTLDGSDPRASGGAVSSNAMIYSEPVPVPFSLVVKTRARLGTTWSALNEVAFVTPISTPLRITELMYHPALPTPLGLAAGFTNENDFEFIELANISTQRIGLAGARFTHGISFTFPNMALAPGECVLIVNHQPAFATRHGTGLNLAGEYDGNLDNSGERLKLVDAFGQTILDFTYNDAWHPLTDGAGHSLVIVDANAATNRWNAPKGWRPSSSTGGSPGTTDPAPLAQSFALWQAAHFTPVEQSDPSVSGPEADPDGDGRPNFEEYALVLGPRQANASGVLRPVIVNGRGTVTFDRLTFATDVVYRIETADDLAGPWRLGSAELAQGVIDYDGLTHTVLTTILAPVDGGGPKFLRLIIEFDP